jgi:hypothetical protein
MNNVTPALFSGPQRKVERAQRHIDNLEETIEGYVARHPYRIVLEATPDGRRHNWTIRVRENIPESLPLVIGDAIHNLRSALDLLACDLVQQNNGSTDNVYFPFAKDETELQEAIKKRHADRAAPDVVHMIRGLKPYKKGGDNLLRAVHDLDIIDKHRLVIPMTHLAEIRYLKVAQSNSVTTLQSFRVGPVQDGQVAVSMPASPNAPLGVELAATLHVTFNHDQPLAGEDVVPQLRKAAEHIGGIIERFRVHCLSK